MNKNNKIKEIILSIDIDILYFVVNTLFLYLFHRRIRPQFASVDGRIENAVSW